MVNALELVAITDFILSAVCLFLAGILFGKIKSHASTSGMLPNFLLFAGLSAFMGGIDHGFFEPINLRYMPRTLTYLFIAIATFFLFKYTIFTYYSNKIKQVLLSIAYIQLIGFIIASFFYHHFHLVVFNYAPVLLFFFIMNLIHIKRSESELNFTLFCIIMIVATLVQALGINLSNLINSDTLFHIIAFFGYLFLYKGVKKTFYIIVDWPK